jgi:transcriptional regulator with XRE-family HTH domain
MSQVYLDSWRAESRGVMVQPMARARQGRKLKLSRGAVLLGKLACSQKEIAEIVGRSGATVSHWRNGERVPVIEDRLKLQATYGIPSGAWDEEPNNKPVGHGSNTAELPTEERAQTAKEMAQSLARQAQRNIELMERDEELPFRERNRLITACTSAIKLLAQCELDEAKIVRSPQWAALKKLIIDALEPFDDATAAVVVAFEEAAKRGEL